MANTLELASAWDFPHAQTLPVPNYDGENNVFRISYLPGQRKDVLGWGVGRFPASDANGLYQNFTVDGYATAGCPDVTFDGMQIRGSASLSRVKLLGVHGNRGLGIEAFGVRSSNQDPHGPGQGGVTLNLVIIAADPSSTYTTGICLGTWFDGNREVDYNTVSNCKVLLPWGDHAGLTSTYRTVIESTDVVGPCYDFYVDSLPAQFVSILGGRAHICKAAVSLVALKNEYKRDLVFRNRTFFFERRVGQAYYALELNAVTGAKSPDGRPLFDNILFENCTFVVPPNEPFYLVSTNYEGAPHVSFRGPIPGNAKLFSKSEPMLDNVYINGVPGRKALS